MLSKKMEEALNKHLHEELGSAYLYLAMSAHLEQKSLRGMAGWLQKQAGEELGHTLKFYNYIHERNGRVTLAAVPAPKSDWESPAAIFEEAYKHECKISGLINQLMTLANSENDHATAGFLQWFVTEQVEEESHTLAVVDKFKLAGSHPGALYLSDKELGARAAG